MEEVAEARLREGASGAEEMRAMQEEGRAMLERLKGHDGAVVALDRQGKSLDSIGKVAGDGPLGLAPEVLQRADCGLSFFRMTFPHQMMRVILLEQIYRRMRIMRHEPYHR
jgi:23S rRNA (pseudouridine1915-N3)-methyltransferase